MYYLAIFLFFSLSFGIIISEYFSFQLDIIIFLLFFSLLATLFLRGILSFFLICFLFFIYGFFLVKSENTASKISSEKLTNGYVFVECIVNSVPTYTLNDFQKFLCKVINSDKDFLIDKVINVYLPIEAKAFYKSHISFLGKVKFYERKIYAYPLRNFLLINNKISSFYYIETFKETLKNNYEERTLSQDTYSLGIAITFGDKSFLETETRKAFIKTGLIHLLVISGMHVAILVFILLSITFFLPKKVREAIPIFVIPIYAFLTGMNIPVVRASTMAVLYYLAKFFYLKVDSIILLFWIGTIFLIFSPSSLYSPSFQLSFLATLGILLFVNYSPKPKKAVEKYILYPVFISFIAVVFISPVLIYHFGGFSLSGILFTPIFIPIVYIYVLLSFLNVITGFLLEPLVKLMDLVGLFFIKAISFLENFSLYLQDFNFNLLAAILFYLAAILVLLYFKDNIIKFSLLILTFFIFLVFSKDNGNTWKIYFYSEKSNPQILIRTPYKECFFSMKRDSPKIFYLLNKTFCINKTFFSKSINYNELKIIRTKNGFVVKSDIFKFYFRKKSLEFKIFTKEVY